MNRKIRITCIFLLLFLVFGQLFTHAEAQVMLFCRFFSYANGPVKWTQRHSNQTDSLPCGYMITDYEANTLIPWNADGSWIENRRRNRSALYCIQPGIIASYSPSSSNPNFNYPETVSMDEAARITGYSMETLNKMAMYSYFGWGNKSHNIDNLDESWMATQELIWRATGSSITTQYYDGAEPASKIYNKITEIENRVNDALVKPSINTSGVQFLIEEEKVLTDTNGKLSNYKVTSTNNCTATIEGNTLKVTGTEVGQASVTVERTFDDDTTPTLYYDHGATNFQDIMRFGKPQNIVYTINFEVIGVRINFSKLDSKTGLFEAQGDATFKGAVFAIYDSNGIEVERVTLDEKGQAQTKPLAPGNYTVREIEAPEGYNISNETFNLVVEAGNEYQDFSIKEEVKTYDVIITKKLEATDYDSEINLAGVQFKIVLKSAKGTAKESQYTFYTNVSGEDGICKVEGIPYGSYEAEEVKWPNSVYEKIENFNVDAKDEDGHVYEYNKVNSAKKMNIVVRKQDYDADIYGKNKAGSYEWTQGDATFKGAQYTIYRKYENGVLSDVVDTITIDHQNADGYWCAESKYMWTGTYYVKETKRPEGYLIDENVYTFSQDPATQVEEKITIERALENGGRSTEKVERGRVEVVKFDQNTDKDEKVPAAGAKLWLVLNSTVTGGVDGKTSSEIKEIKGMTYYEVTIDDKGYAEFIDEIYRAEYPEDEYTIPYGKYTIIEVKGSDSGEHTHFFSKPQEVAVKNQGENKYYILGEEIVPMYLQIQKTDKDSGEDVQIAGAKYMVWNVAKDEFVKQKFTPDGEYETVFETGPNGMITLPEKLEAGNYIIYEIEAPKGYYLDEEYKLPVNESDYGNIEKGGALFTIDKEALGVEPDSTGEKVDLYFKAEIANTPLKAKLQIVKTGEQFTGVNQVTDEYKNKYTVTKPKFENKGLKGVTYEIYAAEDIKSKDGRYTYVTAGTKVDTITTNADGIAETKELYCGEYRIVETVTPKGYITDNNIPNVVLKNEGPEKVKTTVKELNNVRQKLSVMIDKVFEDVKYSSSQEIKKEAVFGIYANQDFTYSNGDLAIAKNTLVATTKVVEGVAQDTDSIDLPEGEYYVKELEASYPYTILDETKNVTLKYDSNGKEKLTFGAGEFINVPETATVTLIKLSTSTLEDVVLNGNEIDTSKLDEEVQALLKELSGKSTEEVKSYLQERNVKFVAGAKYGVYIDEHCTEPLYMEDDEGQLVQAIMETDDTGLITMGEVPLGTYYFKEIEAPVGYELSKDTIKLELTLENKDAVVYQALVEEPVVSRFITKTDIFTGDVIPDCVFEIKDEEGKVLLHDKTDKKGNAYIPLDLFKEGETYQFVEIEAPEIYDLNTEPHEFTAHFDEDGRWAVEKMNVENRRKTGKVTVLKTDEKTGEPLEGCKFSIVLLDENGNEYVNAQGDKVYLVENAVTGEDGKYVIEEAPYGTYKFIEVEAPEGYEKVEEEMENYVFEVNEESQEVLFEVTNTGDIAVYVLCVVALVSIFGIVYVTRKTEKENY